MWGPEEENICARRPSTSETVWLKVKTNECGQLSRKNEPKLTVRLKRMRANNLDPSIFFVLLKLLFPCEAVI